MPRPDLRRLPPPFRVLGIGFLLSLGLAYGVALLFVFVQTDMRPQGIEDQYRGTSEATASGEPAIGEAEDGPASLGSEWQARNRGMKFPKSLKDMILTTHLHMLSIGTLLLLVGALFACSSFPEKAKPWIIAAGFAGLVLTYACMWGLRYIGPAFSAGVFLAGLLQALAMGAQVLAALKDLLFPGATGRSAQSPG